MSTAREQLARDIYAACYLKGDFLLRSGQRSNEYFDKYLFEANPEILERVAEQMASLVPGPIDFLAGLEMGGIPISTALSLKTRIPSLFVRKKAKPYGTERLAEGAQDIRGKKLLIIEDVITTGGQVILSAEDLKAQGAEIVGVLCAILRNPEGKKILSDKGLPLINLFSSEDLKSSK